VLAAGALIHAGQSAASEALKITSEPTGASLEVNGTLVGQTPVTLESPGVYFHSRTRRLASGSDMRWC
jgi:hypothetical protein